MIWQNPVLDQRIEHDALRAAFASVFSLAPSRIHIIDYPNMWSGPIPPEPRIVLTRIDHEGPFPMHLNVALVGETLERPVAGLAGTLDYARALARRLNVTMLFGTGPIANLEQLRVAPDGTIDVVELDDDELDEERFVIVASRPFTELSASTTSVAAS
jgi:hypothetical protein